MPDAVVAPSTSASTTARTAMPVARVSPAIAGEAMPGR